MQIADKQADRQIYYIMSDQPDCCATCGSRLDLVTIEVIDDERVFICKCLGCRRVVRVVEE